MGELSDAELYAKHAAELIIFATGLVGPTDAQDVLSGAIVRLLGSAAWAGAENQRAYLFRAVLNEARMQRRANGRRIKREERSSVGERIEPTTDVEILAPILALSMRQRAVVLLTYWQDMDQASIGALLGISRGAVARHLARAHDRLRELITND